jgi:RimJ/RimL family protein N-acetyltransferase
MFAVTAGEKTEMVGQYLMTKVPGLILVPGMYQAFAFLNDSKDFVGGCVVTNFRPGQYGNDCEISVAAETPMAFRPHLFKAVFQYIFVQLGCVRCTCVTTKKNRKGRAFIERSGFELEGNIRRGYDGKRDALVFGLLRENCRYLAGGLDGEEKRASAAADA